MSIVIEPTNLVLSHTPTTVSAFLVIPLFHVQIKPLNETTVPFEATRILCWANKSGPESEIVGLSGEHRVRPKISFTSFAFVAMKG